MSLIVASVILVLIAVSAVILRGRVPLSAAVGAFASATVGAAVAGDSAFATVVQVCALLLTVVQTFLVLRHLPRNVLSQFRVEIGLVVLATIAMTASIFVAPASTTEKRLVMTSIYSAALCFGICVLHVPIVLVRLRRDVKGNAAQV